MSAFQHELLARGSMADLPEVIAFIDQCATQARVDAAVRFDLQLAVEEACANVIEHAYGGKGGDFQVRFEASEHDVTITVHDHGRPFTPGDVSEPNLTLPLEERRIGGLGLYLMRRLMDEVRFSFAEDGNTLVMVKHDVITPARWANAA
jgi:anti-sigma regulatory factor (Ser/Thr protein kinase)